MVVAIPPKTACEVLGLPPESPLARWTASRYPSRQRVSTWPSSGSNDRAKGLRLGLDRPYYDSVHSAAAKLCARGFPSSM